MPLTAENGFLPDLDGIGRDVTDRANLLFCNYPNNPTGAVGRGRLLRPPRRVRPRSGRARSSTTTPTPRSRSTATSRRASSPRARRARGRHRDVLALEGLQHDRLAGRGRRRQRRHDRRAPQAEDERRLRAVRRRSSCGRGRSSGSRATRTCAQMRDVYRRRRDLVIDALAAAGLEVAPPRGTIYVWVPVPQGHTSVSFAELVLQQADVVVSPGSAYGPERRGVRAPVADRGRRAAAGGRVAHRAAPARAADGLSARPGRSYTPSRVSRPQHPPRADARAGRHHRLPAARDRRRGRARRDAASSCAPRRVDAVATLTQHRRRPDPRTYLGPGKVDELRELVPRARGRGGGVRRRARAAPAAGARGRAPDAGRRPHHRDPRHLRPARPHRRGQAPGRARPARVLDAAHARDVEAPRAAGRRRRHARPGRDAARVRPADRPPQGRASARPASRRWPTGAV